LAYSCCWFPFTFNFGLFFVWSTVFITYRWFFRCSPSMLKPHKMRSYHLLYYRWWYPNFLSNSCISVSISSLWPLIQHNIIYVTLNFLSCWLFTAQHSHAYNIACLIIVRLSFPLAWEVLFYCISHLKHSFISSIMLGSYGFHCWGSQIYI
jgi:hypothetical protein